ncbi:MAG: SsrA-binding protein [Alphaproteobacteria bacterium MarineAlpha5_Bin9]|nr:MAG: SsrA-binding protein [Alphaproteobacteria bacterium MarineAlpha5_Bin9]|tara:strand:- start:1775 stop:2221 length:447 start_codon:yes stop_codon:yes gene_type:complete
MKIIAQNKKARHDYIILEKIEAGIVLTGSEIKSLRINTGSIKESYVSEKKGELWLINCYIKKYLSSNENNYDPLREKKVLLKKKELNNLIGNIQKKGNSLIPISMYFNEKGVAKMLLGLAKGKKKYDKREAIKSREWNLKKERIQKYK